jgi:hypothetical protein
MSKRPVAILLALGFGLSACGGGGSASSASFCSRAKSDSKDFSASASAAASQAEFEKLESDAPSAIKSDMLILVSLLKTASSKTVPSAAELAKLETAAKNVENYMKDTCKIDVGGS